MKKSNTLFVRTYSDCTNYLTRTKCFVNLIPLIWRLVISIGTCLNWIFFTGSSIYKNFSNNEKCISPDRLESFRLATMNGRMTAASACQYFHSSCKSRDQPIGKSLSIQEFISSTLYRCQNLSFFLRYSDALAKTDSYNQELTRNRQRIFQISLLFSFHSLFHRLQSDIVARLLFYLSPIDSSTLRKDAPRGSNYVFRKHKNKCGLVTWKKEK